MEALELHVTYCHIHKAIYTYVVPDLRDLATRDSFLG